MKLELSEKPDYELYIFIFNFIYQKILSSMILKNKKNFFR